MSGFVGPCKDRAEVELSPQVLVPTFADMNPAVTYREFAVAVVAIHHGDSLAEGHYMLLVKGHGRWLHYNDAANVVSYDSLPPYACSDGVLIWLVRTGPTWPAFGEPHLAEGEFQELLAERPNVPAGPLLAAELGLPCSEGDTAMRAASLQHAPQGFVHAARGSFVHAGNVSFLHA